MGDVLIRILAPVRSGWTMRYQSGSYPAAETRRSEPDSAIGGAMKFRNNHDMSAKPTRKIARPKKKDEGALDHWVTKKLHQLYDPVLNEKIPDDLSRLLDDFAKKPGDKAGRG